MVIYIFSLLKITVSLSEEFYDDKGNLNVQIVEMSRQLKEWKFAENVFTPRPSKL